MRPAVVIRDLVRNRVGAIVARRKTEATGSGSVAVARQVVNRQPKNHLPIAGCNTPFLRVPVICAHISERTVKSHCGAFVARLVRTSVGHRNLVGYRNDCCGGTARGNR